MMRVGTTSLKIKQYKGGQTNNATTLDLAKEARDSTTIGANKACSNKGSRKNRYSNGMPKSAGRVHTSIESICYEYKQGKKLL